MHPGRMRQQPSAGGGGRPGFGTNALLKRLSVKRRYGSYMAMSGYMSLSDRVRGRKRNHIADSGTPKEVPYPVLRFRAESDESHNRLGKIGVEGRPQWRRCDFSSSMLKRSRQGQGSRAVPRRYAGRQREGGTEGGRSSTPASGGGLCFGDVVRGFRVSRERTPIYLVDSLSDSLPDSLSTK